MCGVCDCVVCVCVVCVCVVCEHMCVCAFKKSKAHKLIKIQLSDFVRMMYWYVSTLCQKDFLVNETGLIL